MLFRILKMQVRPDRIAEWLTFTRDIGFSRACCASQAARPSGGCVGRAAKPISTS